MKQFQEFALHEFQSIEDAPFRPEQYSRLKFGCDEAAREMGYEIADAFFQKKRTRSTGQSLPDDFVAVQFCSECSDYNDDAFAQSPQQPHC